MEKGSAKCVSQSEKNQLGCLWKFINIFDLRHFHGNQKLLTNGKHIDKDFIGASYQRSKLNTRTNSSNKCKGNGDGINEVALTGYAGEKIVKTPRKDEISVVCDLKRQITNTKVQRTESQLAGHLTKNHKKANKTSQKSYQLLGLDWRDATSAHNQQLSNSSLVKVSSNKLNMAAMLESFNNHHGGGDSSAVWTSTSCEKYNQPVQINLPHVPMNAETLLDQMLKDAKHPTKESLMELLQDSNSFKQIQHLRYSLADKEMTSCKAKFPECEAAHTLKIRKKRSSSTPLWNKIRSSYDYSSKGKDSAWRKNKVVKLKPGQKNIQKSEKITRQCSSLQSQHSKKKGVQIIKPTHLSFDDLLWKLRQEIGKDHKDQQGTLIKSAMHKLPCLKDASPGLHQDTSSRRTFKSSTDSKRMYNAGKQIECSVVEPEVASTSKSTCKKLKLPSGSSNRHRDTDIFIEAKRRLSERFRKNDEDKNLSRIQDPTTLGMILSSPRNKIFSSHSPNWDRSHGSVAVRMRFAPCMGLEMESESSLQLQIEKKTSNLCTSRQTEEIPHCIELKKGGDQLQNLGSKSDVLETSFLNTEVHEKSCSKVDGLSSNGYAEVVETTEAIQQGDSLSELPGQSVCAGDMCSNKPLLFDKNGQLECSTYDLSLRNEPSESSTDSSFSSSLSIQRVEVAESRIKDGEGFQSPISVLEPFFKDDEASPSSTPSQPEKLSNATSPLDSKFSSSTCLCEEESISARVKLVLQASGLDWDELWVKRESTEQLLEPSLTDEFLRFPTESYCDQKLLFDCINEVVLHLSHCCSRSITPHVSFLKPRTRSPLLTLDKNVIDEVMKWYCVSSTMPRTLDQLAAKHIAKSGTWIDIPHNSEELVAQVSDDVLEESILESIIEICV